MKLDKRYNKAKDDARPLKPRRNGDCSARPIPKNAPSWAVVTPAGQSSSDLDTSSSSSTELEISSTESEPTPVSEPEH